MAREARVRAQSGVYYVKAFSLDKLVFIEEEDFRYFLSLLFKAAEEDFAEICAYCLLDEQICLVVKEGLSGVSMLMRKTLPKYTSRYNLKYSRNGKLFGSRFKSLPLEDETSIKEAVKYVHRLPFEFNIKDGLKYKYSSYNDFFRNTDAVKGGTVMMLFDNSNLNFRMEHDLPAAFADGVKKISDAEIAALLKERFKGKTNEEIENMDVKEQAATVAFLQEKGVSIRRMAALLRVSKSAVERLLKSADYE